MPQLHFYVPENTAEELRKRAEAQGLSLSRYLASLVEREAPSAWPADFFDQVVGGWKGAPLERPPQGTFEERDPIERREKD